MGQVILAKFCYHLYFNLVFKCMNPAHISHPIILKICVYICMYLLNEYIES